ATRPNPSFASTPSIPTADGAAADRAEAAEAQASSFGHPARLAPFFRRLVRSEFGPAMPRAPGLGARREPTSTRPALARSPRPPAHRASALAAPPPTFVRPTGAAAAPRVFAPRTRAADQCGGRR